MTLNVASAVKMARVYKLMLYRQHYDRGLLKQTAVCFFMSLLYHGKRNEQRTFSVAGNKASTIKNKIIAAP